MRHLIATLLLTFMLAPPLAHAKRSPPPKVEPVVYGGVRYTAPNDNGRQAYIQAWDKSTNHMLWSVTVFRNAINPLLEEDVQWVFIKTLRLEEGKLIVIDERDRVYSVDLKTHAVRALGKVSPEKRPASTNAVQRTDGTLPNSEFTPVGSGRGWSVSLRGANGLSFRFCGFWFRQARPIF